MIRPIRPTHPLRSARARFTSATLTALVALALCIAAPAETAAQGSTADSSASPASARRQRANWLGDRREFGVGDIIKVAVDEFALATADKGTSAEASRKRRLGLDIEPPSSGTSPSTPIDGSFESSDGSTSRQRGSATRKTRYLGEIPVQVVSITPEGLLRVEGRKLIDVDNNPQELTLSGTVRPQDIDARDIVSSTAIADAQLVYKSKGLDKPRSGLLSRIIGIIWP